MLCGKNHCIQTYWLAVLIVLYRNLGLSIRTKVGQGSVFAHLGQLTWPACEPVRSDTAYTPRSRWLHNRTSYPGRRHRWPRSRSSLILFSFASSALSTPIAISVDCSSMRSDHAAGICVKTVFSSGVADLTNGIANDLLNIYICLCGDLTHDHNQTGGGCMSRMLHGSWDPAPSKRPESRRKSASHILSGCPSVTDSDVNNLLSMFSSLDNACLYFLFCPVYHIRKGPHKRTNLSIIVNPLIVRYYSLRLAPSSEGLP